MSKRRTESPPRVLLALGWYDHRVHQGIEHYAREHGWHLCPDVTRERVVPWGWEGDGILAWLGAGDDLAGFVVKTGKPTVDFSFRRPHLGFPRVLYDHVGAARLAVDDFLSRGLQNFLFYSDADNWSFEERGVGFAEALNKAGYQSVWLRWHRCASYTAGPLQWKRKRKWLASELGKAPKPVGLFAASDDHALEVLECCEAAGLTIPEEVAIIGADNSLLAVDAMRIPISSVDTNMELIGYRGAQLLDRLMHGDLPPAGPIRVPPLGLIHRKSSDVFAVRHRGLVECLRFMWNHFCEPIGVDDLARAARLSRSGLHQAFIEHLGYSPGSELHRLRVEHAKVTLAVSSEKLHAIAHGCGFRSTNSFMVAFKQATGLSPRDYRKQFLPYCLRPS